MGMAVANSVAVAMLGARMPATPPGRRKACRACLSKTPLGAGAHELDAGRPNYLGNVMRLKEGGRLLLFRRASGEWLAEVVAAAKGG
jgi:hypothetical protein